LPDIITPIIELLGSVPAWLRNLIAGIAIMLETAIFAGLIVPGDTVVLVSSTQVQDWGDFAFLLLAVLTGSLIGETIGYSIGRWFGPRLKTTRLGKRIGAENWQRAEELVEKRGGIAVFISRFLPVLHSVVPAVAGVVGMRYRTFISYTFFACLIWASMYVGVGYLARTSFDSLSSDLRIASLVGVGILVVFLILVGFSKKILDRLAK
jgi:membrane protein DedA with SNARE-associated domain